MPIDRADAVVIGAGVEGLTAALSLVVAGKSVVCADRRGQVALLGRPDEAWVLPAIMRSLGLFRQGLSLSAPNPHLAFQQSRWLAVWPDSERTARGLPQPDADAFLEFAAALRRFHAIAQEPGKPARAMLSSLDIVRGNDPGLLEFGDFLRSSATGYLARRMGQSPLCAILLAMAARRSPANPDEAGSAPMLLGLAPFFDDAPDAQRPVSGGQRALIAALAKSFTEAGGILELGCDVREIQMDREMVAGVALSAGLTIKTPLAIAALAPRRLAQGLLSTRRHGRILSRLRSAPRRAQAMMKVSFSQEPDLPDARLGLWRGGVSVWLSARIETLRACADAMRARRIVGKPALELRFAPGLRQALVLSPYCPAELEAGPWLDTQRETLRTALLSTIETELPELFSAIESAELVTPRAPETLSATGAIFATAERMPDLDAIFALGGDAHSTLLKGLILCDPRGLDADGQAGLNVAAAAGGLALGRSRP